MQWTVVVVGTETGLTNAGEAMIALMTDGRGARYTGLADLKMTERLDGGFEVGEGSKELRPPAHIFGHFTDKFW